MTLATALALGALLPGCTSRPAAPRAVFLIVVDTLRPDRLSCYGYQAHATPHIDRLARRGVLFERAQSVASWTVPSMGAMMTSRYPTQLGMVERPAGDRVFKWRERRKQLSVTIPHDETTLAERLGEAGFYSAGFVNQPGINFKDGFLQGFDEWYYPTSVSDIERHDPNVPIDYRKWQPFLQYAEHLDRELVARFGEWLGEHKDGPVFAWVHLLTPHLPYIPGVKYLPESKHPTPSENYDGEVRAVDDMVGNILAAIDGHVGLERSLVIFASDHGEAFGEHDMMEHGHSLHTEVIRVPLIVSAPGLPAGESIDADVRLIDILPTVLDITGLPLTDDIEGASLLPLIDGNGSDRAVYAEAMLYGSTERSLSASGYKLMWDEQTGRYLLFDVTADAGELHDVLRYNRDTADTLATALTAWHARLYADYQIRIGESPDTTMISDEETEELLQMFRSLGYVDK